MKPIEQYIDEVYKKYAETLNNHVTYKKVSMRKKSDFPVPLLVCICLLVMVVVIQQTKAIAPIPTPVVAQQENRGETITFTKEISADGFLNKKHLKLIIDDTDLIAIVSDFNHEQYNYKVFGETIDLISIEKMNVQQIIYGNDSHIDKTENSIRFSKYYGKASLAEIEKNSDFNWEQWEMNTYGRKFSEAEKANVYYEQVLQKGCTLEEGKQYLVFLKYNQEEKRYEVVSQSYGIMEYDPKSNLVKNIDTGKFEEFDWELIATCKAEKK